MFIITGSISWSQESGSLVPWLGQSWQIKNQILTNTFSYWQEHTSFINFCYIMHIYKKNTFLFTLFILGKINNYLKNVHSSSSIIKVKHIVWHLALVSICGLVYYSGSCTRVRSLVQGLQMRMGRCLASFNFMI